MLVRLANDSDVERLYQMLRQVQAIHANGRPDIFKSGTNKYDREHIKELLRKQDFRIYVADSEGVAVGYAFCQIKLQEETPNLNAVKTYYIDDLCVDENYRGHGIGKVLYDFVLQRAKEQGCYHLTLNVWNLNQSAQRFYEKVGMKVLKTTMETILD